jgi:hypothetical protein
MAAYLPHVSFGWAGKSNKPMFMNRRRFIRSTTGISAFILPGFSFISSINPDKRDGFEGFSLQQHRDELESLLFDEYLAFWDPGAYRRGLGMGLAPAHLGICKKNFPAWSGCLGTGRKPPGGTHFRGKMGDATHAARQFPSVQVPVAEYGMPGPNDSKR